MRSPGERELVAIDLGRVAGGTRAKHTTKLRVDHGQRRAEGVVQAVPEAHGFFHAHFWGKLRQVRGRSPSA